MIGNLEQKPKVALLRGAARRGIGGFVRQLGLIGADSLLRKKHLVFRLPAKNLPSVPDIDAITFREIRTLNDLRDDDRCLITSSGSHIDWGSQEWFRHGWRLWVAEVGGRLAALGWWRSAQHSRSFFIPIPDDAEILWHATVLPAYRGRNLHSVLRVALMQQRAKEGVNCFFTNCRDYNTPSYRNIKMMGFEPIGYCTESRLTGRRAWHPLPSATHP